MAFCAAGTNHAIVRDVRFIAMTSTTALNSGTLRVEGERRPRRSQWVAGNLGRRRAAARCTMQPKDSSTQSASGDDEFIECSILEAVEVKSGSEGFHIKMRDGKYVKCVHNNPEGGHLPDYAPQPAIVLKLEDGSNLLLPIIVLELPSTMLMEAVKKVHITRPTIYQVLKNLIDLMGFEAKLVRVTKRVHEAYYAQLFLSKAIGGETEEIVLDLRPSDAINIAARCHVPIQVNKQLAYGDGVKMINEATPTAQPSSQSQHYVGPISSLFTNLDRPELESSIEAGEFSLVKGMLIAAVEERYIDAARIRDELKEFRSKKC